MQTPSQRQNQTTTTTLPPLQQQNVDLLMSGAGNLYRSGGPQYFPDQTYAGPTPWELSGRESATNYVTGAGQDYINAAQAGDKFWLDPANIYDPSKIPGFDARQAQVTQNITNNLTRNVLPSIRSGEIANGMFGGSSQGISEGLATGETSRAIGEALTSMELGAYNSGLNMYNQAANRAPMMFDLGLRPADVMNQVGASERADSQQAIDEAKKRFDFEQMKPYMLLQMLQGLTGTAGQYGGTTSSSGTMQQDGGNGAMQAMGTMLMFLSML